VLAAGCSQLGLGGSSEATSDSAVVAANVDAAPRLAAIPGLELVAVADLSKGASAKKGAVLEAGSYKPAVTGDHIASVQWVLGDDDGINRPMLSLQFDDTGKRDYARLINNVADKDVLVVLNGTVLGRLAIHTSVEPEALTIGSPEVLAARSEIDSATVSP
jgi:hypothetical protein